MVDKHVEVNDCVAVYKICAVLDKLFYFLGSSTAADDNDKRVMLLHLEDRRPEISGISDSYPLLLIQLQ